MNTLRVAWNPTGLLARCQAYYELCKPRVVGLMVFTSWVGMLLAEPGHTPWAALIYGTIGIALMAGSAAALNHVVDRRIDAEMRRTQNRPIPKGYLNATRCLVFAALIGGVGLAILITRVNLLTAGLTFLALIGYAVIYTLYLKRATPQNIVIGGLAGAMPPLLGWTAVTGHVAAYPLILVLIIFAWTPPHFWALALYRKEEYAKVGVPMLPVTHGEAFTRLQVVLYTWLLAAITLLPFLLGGNGVVYLAGVAILNAVFLFHAHRLYRTGAREHSIKMFVFSIAYLMLLFALLLFDRYLPLFLQQLNSH
ncbi:MAG: heme o synthase [Gammaproteobacteria bacterium]|jgi:protoheme IX farnesyltransferase